MLGIRKKTIFSALILCGAIIFVVAGVLAYTNLYMNKERRFWAAIENGLRTNSVTKEVVQDNPNGSSIQLSRMNFGPNTFVEGKTSVYNRTSTVTSTTIVTRTLTTKDASFVQYEDIQTNEKKDDDSAFDFTDVIGTWAKQDTNEETGKEQLAENFIQLVPFASLDGQVAQDFVKKLREVNAYSVDFGATEEDSKNKLTVYSVTVNAKAYVSVLSEVMEASGFGQLPMLDESQYDATSTIKIKLAIDSANTVRKIAFSESEFESYLDYGASFALQTPDTTISLLDLQTRLQSAR